LPEVVKTVENNMTAESAIVEGKVISLDTSGTPIAFQHLMRRFKRIRYIPFMAERILLTLYLFDILYLNSKSLISLPYTEPRKILVENAGQIALSK
jgi:DNA ligase 1